MHERTIGLREKEMALNPPWSDGDMSIRGTWPRQAELSSIHTAFCTSHYVQPSESATGTNCGSDGLANRAASGSCPIFVQKVSRAKSRDFKIGGPPNFRCACPKREAHFSAEWNLGPAQSSSILCDFLPILSSYPPTSSSSPHTTDKMTKRTKKVGVTYVKPQLV